MKVTTFLCDQCQHEIPEGGFTFSGKDVALCLTKDVDNKLNLAGKHFCTFKCINNHIERFWAYDEWKFIQPF